MNTKLSVFCEKVIEAGWLVALVAVPLFFNIYSARTFEPDKITTLRVIVAIMILAWIIKTVEQGRLGDGSRSFKAQVSHWLKMPLVLPTLGMIIVYLVSTIFSISPQVSLWGSYQRLQGTYSMLSYILVFALMAGSLRTREQVDRLVTLVIVASVPVSLYGIIQRFGLDPLPWAGDVTTRVASNMGNAIFVASYLIMIIPITLSRLIESMAAIIKEEKASWGHTILAAVYIFILAIQIIAVVFSQSRGPMLGILGAVFVMGILVLLLLRQVSLNSARLSAREMAGAVLFVALLGLAGGGLGAVGYFIGRALPSLDNASLLGGALGLLLGFLGLYTYMAATNKGWRWLWLSWVGVAAVAIVFMVALNVRGNSLDPYLNPVRELPYLNRLARVTDTERTGKVRIYIWDAAMQLVAPHDPLGIPEDPDAKIDSFNVIRPLIGYGPESMFNAFAYVYPPGLAYVENRGSSADRSHNETMDSLVITGWLGFAAFYFLMISVFYYALAWLGWTPNKAARQRLIALLIGGGVIGAVVPYLAEGKFTFMPVGLPFGVIAGLVLFLIWQGLMAQPAAEAQPRVSQYSLLLIGVLGAIIGHFIEVHFVFSIAATYTYFWAYLGLLVALARLACVKESVAASEPAAEPVLLTADAPEESALTEPAEPSRRGKRSRRRAVSQKSAVTQPVATGAWRPKPESWETWLGSQGLAMAIILIIMAFDFITPQLALSLTDSRSGSFIWMVFITWVAGAAIALSTLAVRRTEWSGQLSWPRAGILYGITSLSYFFFYAIAHTVNFGRRITVTSIDDVVRAAGVLSNGLIIFYLFLLVLMLIIAFTLTWRQVRGLTLWRSDNWWLYPPLLLAIVAVIWFKNVNVVRADILLKEGERYRNQRQWDEAIALHEFARSLDTDEDFYYLMLALDYQLMAQDGNLDAGARQEAWLQGEQIALLARAINPYNPDNTGNMGRYYFTLGQVFERSKFQDALDFFRKATIMAPSNVTYHNLWAQTYYIMQDYDAAIDRLQTSVSIDGQYPPTWVLLGDTYAAKGDIDRALAAHAQGMRLQVMGSDGWNVFADQFLDQRLNFYISAGRGNDIIAAMQQVALERPTVAAVPQAIGQAYNLMGQREQAIAYFEQAQALGDGSDKLVRNLANTYLASNQLEQAIATYDLILANSPADVEANSALAYIYAQQGRLDDAILYNKKVLEASGTDYDSLKNLAILYQQKQEWQNSLTYAQQAEQVAPDAEKPSWGQFIQNLQAQMGAQN